MKTTTYIYLYIVAVMAGLVSVCSCGNEEIEAVKASEANGPYVYRMRMEAAAPSFGREARSSVEWQDGSTVYLRFQDGDEVVTGVASYNASNETWTVVAQNALTSVSGQLTACYFESPASVTSSTVSLSTSSVVYVDEKATYEVKESVITVRASLFPLTGRLRLQGNQGQSYGLTGLSYYTAYNIETGQFTEKPQKLSGTIGATGTTDYFYMFFTNKATMYFDYTSTACFKAALPDSILLPGTSGYLTIPTKSTSGNWTLVNSQDDLPITLPEISEVIIDNLCSTAEVSAKVTSQGNGKISDAGFVLISLTPNPIETKVSVGANIIFEAMLDGLEPKAGYEIYAYATNEMGTNYGPSVYLCTNDQPAGSNSGGRLARTNWLGLIDGEYVELSFKNGGTFLENFAGEKCYSTYTELDDNKIIIGEGTVMYNTFGWKPVDFILNYNKSQLTIYDDYDEWVFYRMQ